VIDFPPEVKRKNPPPTPASVRGRPKPRTLRITFEISSEHGPALRSAIEEISNEIGGRLEGAYRFAREDALTYAATALGSLRAAINEKVPEGSKDYAG
jgi:hypothetical protein